MEIVTRVRKPRRALQVTTSVISVLFTLVGLAFLLPSLFGLQRFVITGTSMTGTIDRGSVVLDEVVPVSDLQVGDIITYQPPVGAAVEDTVTHRIVAIHGDVFRTQGDAVPQKDPWKFRLDRADQARVRLSVPYAGYPLIWLADRATRILVISVPAALIALVSLGQAARVVLTRPRSRDRRDPHPTVGT